ncbi:Diphthamide biosynthesis protein 4 [Yarrowia sp. B02]|nr:Diphthamide biosynthesis protein 4 [Yarrowia sp. B02]
MNHYTILGLSEPPHVPELTAADLKRAYKDALLKNHPDKLHEKKMYSGSVQITAITTAYACLSNSKMKKEYDQNLRNGGKGVKTGPGSEVFDLTELEEREDDQGMFSWYKPCRCGEAGGYVLTEAHLEKNEEYYQGVDVQFHEIVVQCGTCSLWITVQYGVEEDEEEEEQEE